MLPSIPQAISKKPVTHDDIIAFVNRELKPVLEQIRNKVNARFGIAVTVAGDYTIAADVGTVLVDAAAGPITVYLPDASSWDRDIHVKKIDATVNVVTVLATHGQTVDGALGADWFTSGQCVGFRAIDGNFYVVTNY